LFPERIFGGHLNARLGFRSTIDDFLNLVYFLSVKSTKFRAPLVRNPIETTGSV